MSKASQILRNVYRVTRSVMLVLIISVISLYLFLYIALAIPGVQNYIKGIAERELSSFLKGNVEIGRLDIVPFSEVRVYDLIVSDTVSGQPCLQVARIGAALDIADILLNRRISIPYAEISGMRADITQSKKDGPLNIDFIINAFSPKEKKEPPTRFDLRLRKIAIRNTSVSFSKLWIPQKYDDETIDFNHFAINSLAMDLRLPRLSNEEIEGEVSRMSFNINSLLTVQDITFNMRYTPTSLNIYEFVFQLVDTSVSIPELSLVFDSPDKIKDTLNDKQLQLSISEGHLTPAELSPILPIFRSWDFPVDFSLMAEGNINQVDNLELALDLPSAETSLFLKGTARELMKPKFLETDISELKIQFAPAITSILSKCLPHLGVMPENMIRNLGRGSISLKGNYNVEQQKGFTEGSIKSGLGNLDFNIEKSGYYKASLYTDDFNVGSLLGIDKLGAVAFDAGLEVSTLKNISLESLPDGFVNLDIDRFYFNGNEFSELTAEINSNDNLVDFLIKSESAGASFGVTGDIGLAPGDFSGVADLDIEELDPSLLGFMKDYSGYKLHSIGKVHFSGPDLMTADINLDLKDISFVNSGQSGVNLDYFSARLGYIEEETRDETDYISHGYSRELSIKSPWMDLSAEISDSDNILAKSIFDFRGIVNSAVRLVSETFPVLQLHPSDINGAEKADIRITFKADADVYRFWKLPVYPLGEASLTASIDGESGLAEFELDAPYIQQGKNTLIEQTCLYGRVSRDAASFNIGGFTHYPTKKGTLDIDLNIKGRKNSIYADLGFRPGPGNLIAGNLAFNTLLKRNPLTDSLDCKLDILPSVLAISGNDWKLAMGQLEWSGDHGKISNLNLESQTQYININGIASSHMDDEVVVRLGGIDLDYVFGILNINYVTFGGIATGELTGKGVLSDQPELKTKFFHVDDFSYNSSKLGDADIYSWFDVLQKKVGIQATITENEKRVADIDGGIWVTRDSLSFGLDARHINAGFMSPFVSAFAVDVSGRASGNLKLYGTFSDIDLTGRAKADSLSLKLISTNVVYTGSDSIILNSGTIEIPGFRVYDRNGNSALLTGTLKHRYFHEPEFDFRLSDAHQMLCYDTNAAINPIWYGTIYASGSGHIYGYPGFVGVDVDMVSDRNSSFTFELSDREEAADYNFLTFTDVRKEAAKKLQPDTVPAFLKKFRRQVNQEAGEESTVELNFRATVTPGVLVTLVMDPQAGDKITTRGNGALQMSYNSKSEDLRMYGKYMLDEGEYNFSLQDIILKQFTIRPGSSISFNGDPYSANLDIAATYRVNANLTDLDQSFANDHELTRTNVPVDAVMLVRGDLDGPDITFDVELPTLTADVERKVKSLMSTDDLLSRQIIYLPALNRFYTPENVNMGTSGSSGSTELTSVASSTISSHLSNILSSMSDHLMVAPSFRSDKGDFSDVEVDLGLSSRLLDNRLLINGNLGYRDRNISGQSTQLIGDFDIEYLLNRSGNLRLKAYNRFNDQNYYLRQALTTQGVGVVVRRDFDSFLSFLRPIRRKLEEIKDKKDNNDEKQDEQKNVRQDREEIINKTDENVENIRD